MKLATLPYPALLLPTLFHVIGMGKLPMPQYTLLPALDVKVTADIYAGPRIDCKNIVPMPVLGAHERVIIRVAVALASHPVSVYSTVCKA